ncbi:DUF1289 domain-containing protein [Vandammella animalimorsus]|nr:DUF1289 domain-containing protein [Vandammella animalimorsus]
MAPSQADSRHPNPTQAAQRLLARAQQLRAQGLLHDGALQPPPSPCIQVCAMSAAAPAAAGPADAPAPHCLGCYRQLDEIAQWGQASAARKRAIWQAMLQRAAARLRQP